ncbi:hypothetical protein [Sphingopyxis sp. 22461]|uniref:hypothetical protein n=1 Tax=Sphingopyxis sp. 22461 TaxID=3453923 RepID=UPI003F87ADCC
MGAPVNHKRMKGPPPKQPAHIERVKGMGCLICGYSPVDAHHVRTGLQTKNDARIVPLCRFHHQDSRMGFHGLGSERAFYQEYGVSLLAEAERLAGESREQGLMK